MSDVFVSDDEQFQLIRKTLAGFCPGSRYQRNGDNDRRQVGRATNVGADGAGSFERSNVPNGCLVFGVILPSGETEAATATRAHRA